MNKDIDIKELFRTIHNYRWLIFIIVLIAFFAGKIYLYFQPSIYSSHALIKVKSHAKLGKKSSSPFSSISTFETGSTREDVELLKTFYINSQALNHQTLNSDGFDYIVQYYMGKSEILGKKPIKIVDIKISDGRIFGKKLIITPRKNGYTIQFKHSTIDKLQSRFLKKKLFRLTEKKFKYNEIISTKYFKLKVKKLSNFETPLYLKFNGDNRYIYEKIIKKNLKISQIEDELSIIKLTYKDNIRKRSISYIDALTDSFIKENIKNKNEQSDKILEFITKELNRMKDKLEISEKELENYRVSNKVIQPSIEAATFIRKLSEIDISLSENQLKERLIGNIIKFIEAGYNLDSIAPSLMELNEKPTLNLIRILQDSQLERDELLVDFTEKHPIVKTLNGKIKTLKSKINLNIRNFKRHIEQKNESLTKLKSSYESKLKTLPVKERKLINIKRDYEVSSTMYNFLLKKEAENGISRVATLSDYKIIDRAYGSPKPISPKTRFTIISFMIIGFIIGVAIAFIHNLIKDKIRTKEDIETQIDFPIYGVIPSLKDNIAKLEIYNNPKSYFTDSYRRLRLKLQLLLDERESGGKVILLSSTVTDEGKNITTVNLSAIFQIANYKVVTIDLDMRSPSVAKLFDIVDNISVDIGDYLGDKCCIDDIIYPTIYENLHIIPIKEIPSNPSELILSPSLPKLIKELKKSYDYIIINSTPFGEATDTEHVMKFSDINLFLFREGYSKKRFISKLTSIIERDRVENMGVVFIESQVVV